MRESKKHLHDVYIRHKGLNELKRSLKPQKKLKEVEIMYQNAIYISIPDITKFANFL